MNTLLVLLATSFVLGLLLTPVARRIALQFDLVDQPDGRRKMHGRPIPVAGGVAIFAAATLSLAALLLFPHPLRDRLLEQGHSFLGLLLASIVICGVGLADDFRALRGRHKLFGQLIAVGIVMSSGVEVRTVQIFSHQVELGLLALPFTAFWLLAAINSLNLLDGMDGLLGTVGVIITLTMACLAVMAQQWAAATVACALAGALLAFLCFNFPPASIFMGDCGSMLVGLVVGVVAIQSSLKAPATIALAAPMALLIIPIFDTSAAIVRRKLTGRSIYTTDRGHIHHCLQRYGLSSQFVLLIVSLLCLLTAAGAWTSLAFNSEWIALASGVAVVAILIVTRLFGYAEFLLVKERVRGLWQRTAGVHAEGGHQIRVRLQGSGDWEELWQSLTSCARDLHLQSVRLDINAPAMHEGYHARWDNRNDNTPTTELWRAEIPLLIRSQTAGRLECTGHWDASPIGEKVAMVAQFAGKIERILSDLAALTPVSVVAVARETEPLDTVSSAFLPQKIGS